MLAARLLEATLRCTAYSGTLVRLANTVQTSLCAPTASSAERSARGVSTSAAPHTPPQPGGYLETGHAAGTELVAPRFLVTGASGQIGTELTRYLRNRVGTSSVVASDVRSSKQLALAGPFIYCDVTNADGLARIVLENEISHVVHLATLLSAVGERNPQLALRVNTVGIQNVLDVASRNQLKVFAPSTIAVFGASTPKNMVPEDAVCCPSTMYGITKVHQELLGAYYASKFGVDFRSLRYPGVISSHAPGGGTTDYAVEMYMAAVQGVQYTCFIAPDTPMPMMNMTDCLRATWELMTAPRARLRPGGTYNVTAMSFTPAELEASIRRHYPEFQVIYQPDFRQDIANSWPACIDDSAARADWGWQHSDDLPAMTEHIIGELLAKAAQPPPRNDPVVASKLAQAAFV